MEESVELSRIADDPDRIAALLGDGARITVTAGGRVVAYLVPPERSHLAPADAGGSPFERLVAAGQVRRATGSLLDLMPPPPAEPGERPLSEVLLEMRDEERY